MAGLGLIFYNVLNRNKLSPVEQVRAKMLAQEEADRAARLAKNPKGREVSFSKMACNQCNDVVLDGQQFCPKCGYSLAEGHTHAVKVTYQGVV